MCIARREQRIRALLVAVRQPDDADALAVVETALPALTDTESGAAFSNLRALYGIGSLSVTYDPHTAQRAAAGLLQTANQLVDASDAKSKHGSPAVAERRNTVMVAEALFDAHPTTATLVLMGVVGGLSPDGAAKILSRLAACRADSPSGYEAAVDALLKGR